MLTTSSERGRETPATLGAAPVQSRRRQRLPLLTAIGALLVTTILVVALGNDPPADDESAATRTKTNVHIGFFVERAGAIWPGRPGESVRPGDSVQFTTTTDAPGFVAVLGVTAEGRSEILYPQGRVAAPVPAGQEVGLPASTILDENVGQERVVGLFCAAPVELEPVRLAFEAQPARLAPPNGCQSEVFTWNKRAP